jgi:hypothetical protein
MECIYRGLTAQALITPEMPKQLYIIYCLVGSLPQSVWRSNVLVSTGRTRTSRLEDYTTYAPTGVSAVLTLLQELQELEN